ncbi:MAG TPA: hypothetical protein VM911_01675 [Pyrinomonadaceae bacterium]|nr:hypothetical protein [Pyrinomonadaceae bacterium]
MLGLGASLQIFIQLDRPQGPYYRGDVVHAAITLQSVEAVRVRSISAGLLLLQAYEELYEREERDSDGYLQRVTNATWREDQNWIRTEWLSGEGTIPAGLNHTYRFDWTIPQDAPPTYAGQIARLSWLVRVRADVPMAKDVEMNAVVPVIVPPDGKPQAQQLQQPAHNVSSDVSMRFWLPRIEFLEGETVTGRLIIEPRKNTKARAVRLHLERQETVRVGDPQHGKALSEPVLQIAPPMQLQSGVPVALDFALPVPHRWRPNHRTFKSSSTNSIKAVIDVPWGSDYTCSQEIFLYNGPARS